MLILGIESSCDETAAAVVENGATVRSSVIYSQIATHKKFGGVVPELASREHLEKIEGVVDEALKTAGMTYGDLDGIAVTQGPGLVGSLLVGINSESLVDIEKNIDAGLTRVKDLEERMDMFMEMAEYTFIDIDRADRHKLNEMQANMRREAEMDEANTFDVQIAAGLDKIRREMGKDV